MLVMPADRVGFAWAVFRALGGQPFERNGVVASDDESKVQEEAH